MFTDAGLAEHLALPADGPQDFQSTSGERVGQGPSAVSSGQPEVGYAHRRTPTCAFEFPIHPLVVYEMLHLFAPTHSEQFLALLSTGRRGAMRGQS